MKKVAIKVVKEVKVDGRKNNTGRPVNKKSARQIRLNKQAATKKAMDYVMQGGWFKLTPNCTGAYVYVSNPDCEYGHIATSFGAHECNIDNMIAICRNCNLSMGNTHMFIWVKKNKTGEIYTNLLEKMRKYFLFVLIVFDVLPALLPQLKQYHLQMF